MGRLGQLAKERGVPVLVVTGTVKNDQKTVVLEMAAKWGFELLDIGPVTARVFERNGYPTTEEDMRRLLWVSKGDHHPNRFGHTIYAEGIQQKIEAMGLLTRE